MVLRQLRIQGLRCLEDVHLAPQPGLNRLTGANGAGKTSVLEAVFLLSRGRSFRSGGAEVLLQRGASQLAIFAEVEGAGGKRHRLGLGHDGKAWQARVDGEAVPLLSLIAHCAVVCFEPGSHALISGPAEERRRFLDWGVFHVEQDHLGSWRRYRRALRQRNVLLRERASPRAFEPWEQGMSEEASLVDAARGRWLARFKPLLADELDLLLPELGKVELSYQRGWEPGSSLAEALAVRRERDMARGYTALGVHRADWRLVFENAPLREHLSRGQEKLVALALVLAQARQYSVDAGHWPIFCLDDLDSELDLAHTQQLLQRIRTCGAQVLTSGTGKPGDVAENEARMFHVEQGRVRVDPAC